MRASRVPPSHVDFEDIDDCTPLGECDDRKVVVDVGSVARGDVRRNTVGRGTIVGQAIASRPPAVPAGTAVPTGSRVMPGVPSRSDVLVRYLKRALDVSHPSLALSLLMAWDPEDHRDLMDLLDTVDTP